MHILLGLWLIFALASTYAVWRTWLKLDRVQLPDKLPNVVVIAPVRGGGPWLDEFFRRLRSQNYPAARIVVTMESESDPAYGIARSREVGPGLEMQTLAQGASGHVGQKVGNLLNAISALKASDDIVAFVDADVLPSEDWLLRLVSPILQRRAGAVSGYRWLLPSGDGWGAYWAAATNNAIAGLARSRFWNVAWGGSFAIRRELLDEIEIGSWWRGAVSDDLQMTRALWSHGIKIVGAPSGFVPTPVDCSFAEAVEFGRRQYLLVRTHLLSYWTLAATLVLAPLAVLIVALDLAIRRDGFAIAVIAIIFALGQFRVFLRSGIQSWIARDESLPRHRPSAMKLWVTSLTHPVYHALCLTTAFSSRRIRWSGIDYEILAPQRIRRT